MSTPEILVNVGSITAIISGLVGALAGVEQLRSTRAERRRQDLERRQAEKPAFYVPEERHAKRVHPPKPQRRDLKPLIFSAGGILVAALVLIGIGQLADGNSVDSDARHPRLVDTFDHDAQGWTTIYDAEEVRHIAAGGNPDGYVSATDIPGRATTWYWEAPLKYRGDKSGYMGKVLEFDLKQSLNTEDFPAADVWLLGPNRLELVYDLPNRPGPQWTSYAVRLDGGAGWQRVDYELGMNVPATAEDMRAVLSNLTHLRIRGEYANGQDIGGLDNVDFGV